MRFIYKIFFAFCFLLSTFVSISQVNLVSNPNFENYISCPNNLGQINHAVGWNASSETPDYYDTCQNVNSTNGLNVPYAFFGYQKDCCGGRGYAGGFMFDKNDANNGDRDYINTKLTNTLTVGHKYIAKMYVSRGQAVDYAVTTLGMLFTDTITTLPAGQGFIFANPQIKNTTLLSDTLNWMVIQDTFIAVGNESYLTIGNFNTTASSDTTKLTNYWSAFPIAYYYIDGVSIYEIDGTCNNLWSAGFDKYIIAGDSTRLGSINTDNSTYTWQNSLGGSTDLNSNIDARPWSKPTQTTTYYVIKICPNNYTFIDTVTVYVQPTVEIKKYVDKKDVLVYPNPNNGKEIFIAPTGLINGSLHIRMTDLEGRTVYENNCAITDGLSNIKMTDIKNGVYFINITNTTTGERVVKKLVIQY